MPKSEAEPTFDWPRLREGFKNAVGQLPNYKRSYAFELVGALDKLVTHLRGEIEFLANELADRPARNLEQLDLMSPQLPVRVEISADGSVLYVHVDGYSALRISRLPGVEIVDHRKDPPATVDELEDLGNDDPWIFQPDE